MLTYQAKANLDENILFGKIIHHLDLEIRKMLERACLGTRIPHSILVNNLLTIEIKILFLTLTMQLQCHINHGPEWNVKLSITIQIPYRHFLIVRS